jgi:hypothetical protein
VRDAGAVRTIERIANLHGNGQRVVDWKHRCLLRSRRQRLALEVLEDDVVLVAVAADVVNRADVRIVERCDGARFLLEALPRLGIGGERAGQYLDRDGPIEPRIARAIHLAHAPFAKGRDDFVRTEPRTGIECHVRVDSSAIEKRAAVPSTAFPQWPACSLSVTGRIETRRRRTGGSIEKCVW